MRLKTHARAYGRLILWYPSTVHSSDEILRLIHQDPHLAELLAVAFEFDVTRGDSGETAQLSSAQPLERVAGDFTGGTFFQCGNPDQVRPILYASSEGQAGLIGDDLGQALEIIVGLPYWRDCLGYSGDGDLEVMRTAAQHLQRGLLDKRPEITGQQAELADALSLQIDQPDALLSRLRSVVARSTPDYVFTDETGEYEGLFGPFTPDRNPLWR